MNKLITISTEYLRPSRTIEIINLVRYEESRLVYVYNYEGTHYRVFFDLKSLIQFFESAAESKISFDSEEDLDGFLEAFPIHYSGTVFNLKLNYRYRDGANYKQFGSVIFKNEALITPQKASRLIKEKLISTEFFVPQDWNLPRLQKYPYEPEIDHEWHEFESFEWTDEDVTDNRDILSFLNEIQKGYEL